MKTQSKVFKETFDPENNEFACLILNEFMVVCDRLETSHHPHHLHSSFDVDTCVLLKLLLNVVFHSGSTIPHQSKVSNLPKTTRTSFWIFSVDFVD